MDVPYIEKDCNFKGIKAGGAIVTQDRIIAYPKENGILGDWHGNPIGTWRETARWWVKSKWRGLSMFQIEATVNGVVYTGRGLGVGMIFMGKAKKIKTPHKS
mgnify:CR=1 FL=1